MGGSDVILWDIVHVAFHFRKGMENCTFIFTTAYPIFENAFLALDTKFLRILAPSCGSMRPADISSSMVSRRVLQRLEYVSVYACEEESRIHTWYESRVMILRLSNPWGLVDLEYGCFW